MCVPCSPRLVSHLSSRTHHLPRLLRASLARHHIEQPKSSQHLPRLACLHIVPILHIRLHMPAPCLARHSVAGAGGMARRKPTIATAAEACLRECEAALVRRRPTPGSSRGSALHCLALAARVRLQCPETLKPYTQAC